MYTLFTDGDTIDSFHRPNAVQQRIDQLGPSVTVEDIIRKLHAEPELVSSAEGTQLFKEMLETQQALLRNEEALQRIELELNRTALKLFDGLSPEEQARIRSRRNTDSVEGVEAQYWRSFLNKSRQIHEDTHIKHSLRFAIDAPYQSRTSTCSNGPHLCSTAYTHTGLGLSMIGSYSDPPFVLLESMHRHVGTDANITMTNRFKEHKSHLDEGVRLRLKMQTQTQSLLKRLPSGFVHQAWAERLDHEARIGELTIWTSASPDRMITWTIF